jgi:hypothetical protein
MDVVSKAQEAGAAADELIRQLAAAQQGLPQEQAVSAAPDDTATPPSDGTEEGFTQPAAQTDTAVNPSDTPAAPVDDQSYRAKYEVLQGKYNAEVPRLHAQIKELKATIADMQAALDKAIAQATQAPAANTPSSSTSGFDPLSVVDKQILEDYPPELLRAAAKMAEAIADNRLAEAANKVDARVNQLKQELTIEEFDQSLRSNIERFDEINRDPQFISWLGNVDPRSGLSYQELLLAAYNRKDIGVIKSFFTEYAGLTAPVAPKAKPKDDATQVVPGRSRAGVAPTGPLPAPTRQEIQQFYSDVARGVYRNRPEEVAAFERRIFSKN